MTLDPSSALRRLRHLAAALLAAAPLLAWAQGSVYYICPGNVFTNMLSAKEAEAKGCKAREAQQPTTVPGPRTGAGKPAPVASPTTRSADTRVEQSDQKARDTDARRILESELRKEEEALDALKRSYNNGEPERRGDERNFQKYQDRVAEMKAAITRKEADIAAIRREIGKLPS